MQETKNAANRVAKNTGILYARMAITVFISLYVTRLVVAALGTKDFGIFNIVGGAIAMLTFLNVAMASASQRFMSYVHGEGNQIKQKRIFNVSVILHFLIGIAVVLLLEIAGYFFFNGILKIDSERVYAAKLIYQFLIVSTFFTIISVPYDAVINARENMLFVAVTGIIEALLKLAIAFYITFTNNDKLISYGLLMALLTILLLIIKRIYCHLKYEEVVINIRKYFDKALFKEMGGFGGWSLLGSTVGMLSIYGQGIVINVFFGTAINAAQGIANQINGQLNAFSSTMLKALNPAIIKKEGSGNRDAMLRASITGGKFSFALLALFAIPAIVEMPYILNLWLTEVPEFSIIFCRLLLIKTLIEQQFITLSTSIAATGKIRNFQISLSLLAMLPLVISYFLFSAGFSPPTIYIVFIIQVIFRSFGIILYYAKKVCNLSVPVFLKDSIFKEYLAVTFTLVLIASPFLLMDTSWYRLVAILVLNTIGFMGFFYSIVLNQFEKNTIKQAVYNLKNKLIK
ncbi:MATE family efflux transporter [Jejuia pallidilutea]|uniref:Membrane protein n=1 Tax=Jejuia pallidilutea TaxID=504487 RepID=A0A090W4Y6_9FLAO|nr:MATE family efflux transporter [Jejuia pallidilutea]GAL67508.1 membrane protein [Jejuia pallidilutea]GAL71308.1 membrane protein [Jejuia pallidilutea]GAL88718.1 membrane protein [Jejuia pallidilutea]